VERKEEGENESRVEGCKQETTKRHRMEDGKT
jgi:hypothetical protein